LQQEHVLVHVVIIPNAVLVPQLPLLQRDNDGYPVSFHFLAGQVMLHAYDISSTAKIRKTRELIASTQLCFVKVVDFLHFVFFKRFVKKL
jgi:hypothetical protein